MNVFLLDLWHDLREKRMAPVAILLGAALLAVPFVLRERVEAPAPPPTASATPSDNAAKNLAIKALSEAETPSSDLGVFDPKNPFKPLRNGIKESIGDGKVGVPDTGGADKPGGGGGDAVAASDGASKTKSGSGGGSEGGGAGGGGTGGGSAPRTTTQRFTYVVDVTFARNGRERRVRGMRRLDMLPNESNPLLIFLGVSGRGGDAVFLIDSSLTGAGEGRCKPSATNCSFLYLGPGSEHSFRSEDGDSMDLRIDQIRRVKLRARSSKSSSPRKPAKKRNPKASATTRRFILGDIIDLEAVQGSTADSKGAAARR